MTISSPILYEDRSLLVFNKAAAVPSIPDLTKDESALSYLENTIGSPLFPVNRLDRPVSGCLLFAKNKKASERLGKDIQARLIEKEYLALVEGHMDFSDETLIHFVGKNNKAKKAFISESNDNKSKKAILKMVKLDQTERYTLLHLIPETGRFHQIRVQLAHIGYPIKGDIKYGARRSNKDRSIHLHSWKLSFSHPTSKEILKIAAPLPNESLWTVAQTMIKDMF